MYQYIYIYMYIYIYVYIYMYIYIYTYMYKKINNIDTAEHDMICLNQGLINIA